MHSHEIEGMVKALRPVVKNADRAKSFLERYWRNRIAIIWTTKDVHRAANELRTALTNSEAREMLQTLLHRHNAQLGINWESLISAIEASGKGRDLTKIELKRFIERDIITIQTGR